MGCQFQAALKRLEQLISHFQIQIHPSKTMAGLFQTASGVVRRPPGVVQSRALEPVTGRPLHAHAASHKIRGLPACPAWFERPTEFNHLGSSTMSSEARPPPKAAGAVRRPAP